MVSKISIVVSVYNEEKAIVDFYDAITPVLDGLACDYELLFVNDGSVDDSPRLLNGFAEKNGKVKVIHFTRNYGHEAAMIAGIDNSDGDAIICMDADLQHPVELIPSIIEKFNFGFDIVTMVRKERSDAPVWKKITSKCFYKVMNTISSQRFDNNASDFFGITRKPADVLRNNYRENDRYLRAYVQSIGFKKDTIEYSAADRVAGTSKYSFRKLMGFSVSALISFSNLPLRIASACGTISGVACLVLIIYTVYSKIVQGTPSGYATIIIVMCLLFMILFFCLGIIGEYLAVILAETRKRPIYLVEDIVKHNEKTDDDQ